MKTPRFASTQHGWPVIVVSSLAVLAVGHNTFGAVTLTSAYRWGRVQANDLNHLTLLDTTNIGVFPVVISQSASANPESASCHVSGASDIELSGSSMLVTAEAKCDGSVSDPARCVCGSADGIFEANTVQFSVDSQARYSLQGFSSITWAGPPPGFGTRSAVSFALTGGPGPDPVPLQEYQLVTVTTPAVFSGALSPGAYQLKCIVHAGLVTCCALACCASVSYEMKGFDFRVTDCPPPTEVPRLDFVATNATLTLSWPMCANGFYLEEAASLAQGASWTSAANAPVLVGDKLAVTVGMTNASRFYRLKGSL